MLNVHWPKWTLLLFLLGWIAVLLFGAWQKLRDGEVGWKWSNAVSQRHGRDPAGFWISVGLNLLFAVAALALAFSIFLDRIPVTWGGAP